jgi:NADPH2:quinone reductase
VGLTSALPATKMAIQQQSFGGADVLRPAELPLPEVRCDEVLVEVTLAGVNFGDLQGRQTGDNHILAATLPFVPGSEIVGRRVDTGQRVLGLCGLGGYAQYAAVPAGRLFAVPEDIDDGTALALFVAGTTAWHLLRTCARLAAGESVAVHGAAGAVGCIAIQLAKSFGAGRVVGSASGRHRRDFALGHGADAIVDSAPDGLYGRLLRANRDEPFDVVLDSTGGAALADSLAGLAPFGRLVLFATAAGPPPPIAPGRLIAGSRSITGFWLMDCFARDGMIAEALTDLFERTTAGALRAEIGAVLPLAQAGGAHEMISERRVTGKVLLAPAFRLSETGR